MHYVQLTFTLLFASTLKLMQTVEDMKFSWGIASEMVLKFRKKLAWTHTSTLPDLYVRVQTAAVIL